MTMNTNMSNPQDDSSSPADEAMARRLSKLRTMPVDTSRLSASLRNKIPPNAEAPARPMYLHRFRPLRALAAGVLVFVVLGASLLIWSARPAEASAALMAQMHDDIVSGRTPVAQVDSIEQANLRLSQDSEDLPTIPTLPSEHVMACCMKSVKHKKVVCVLLKNQGVPVTMAVASSQDIRLSKSAPSVLRGGQIYHVESAGQLNMVSTERAGRYVCIIGAVPAEKLMELADKMQF